MGTTGRVLAVDLGARRVGLALSDEMGLLATPKPPIVLAGDSRAELLDAVEAAVGQYEAAQVLIGWPLKLNGSRGAMAERAEHVATALQRRLACPVALFDERLSSRQAEARLLDQGMRRERRRQHIDGAAAAVILEAFLARERRKSNVSRTE